MAVEEQTVFNATVEMYVDAITRTGQHLVIPNRTISKLEFLLYKQAGATGDVYFRFRRVSDDGIIAEKLWGDASALNLWITWESVIFDPPITINDEVHMLVERTGRAVGNFIGYRTQNTDVKAGEYLDIYWGGYADGPWATHDGTYKYTYTVPPVVGLGADYRLINPAVKVY